MRRLLPGMLAAVILAISLAVEPATSEPLRLTIEFDKKAYVVQEPVRLFAKLENVSSDEIRIVEISELDTNMNHMYLEVVSPSGDLRLRRSKYYAETAIANPGYTGEPLASGGHVTVFLYPNETVSVEELTGDAGGPTFAEPGEYQVRLVYAPASVFALLQVSESGIVRSNEVTLRFEEPDPPGREILDAIWRTCGLALSQGDMLPGRVGSDTELLRDMIAAYPDHELTRYAMFYRAKDFAFDASAAKLAEVRTLITDLRARWPRFREEEVLLTLARTYRCEKQWDEVMQITNEALTANPDLRHQPDFMWERIVAEYRTVRAVGRWKENRKLGVAEPDKNLIVD